jgi:hypothetical protein
MRAASGPWPKGASGRGFPSGASRSSASRRRSLTAWASTT